MRIPLFVIVLVGVVILFSLVSSFRLFVLSHDIMGFIVGFIAGCIYMSARKYRSNR